MKRKFVKGPIPLSWLGKLLERNRDKKVNVGLAIWYKVGLQKRKTIILSRRTTRLFKVTRQSTLRVLKRLEDEGLIFIQRRPGKLSLITVLDFKPEEQEGQEGYDFDGGEI